MYSPRAHLRKGAEIGHSMTQWYSPGVISS